MSGSEGETRQIHPTCVSFQAPLVSLLWKQHAPPTLTVGAATTPPLVSGHIPSAHYHIRQALATLPSASLSDGSRNHLLSCTTSGGLDFSPLRGLVPFWTNIQLTRVCFDHIQPVPTVTTLVFNNNILHHPILNFKNKTIPPLTTDSGSDLRAFVAGYQNMVCVSLDANGNRYSANDCFASG